MPTTTADSKRPNRLETLARQSPALTGALVLGAGLGAAGNASAALIIQEINQTVPDGGELFFDLDQDGTDDFSITAIASTGSIQNDRPDAFISQDLSKSGATFALQLQEGDEVGGDLFDGTNGGLQGKAFFYTGTTNGSWGATGEHGFAALRLDFGGGVVNYGWVEATRGSLTVGRVGYQTTAGAAAPIPTAGVPEPATLALLASGAVGMLGMRRRRRASKQATH